MADNQSVMGSSGPLAEPAALAGVAGRPGLRYAVLLVAIAAGLIGSAALLGHAANALTLSAYDRSVACGATAGPDCRAMATGTMLDDRPLPLDVHAVTIVADGRQTVYYGWANTAPLGPAASNSRALLLVWRGRVARVFSAGLALDPFEGPPGAGFLLIAAAVLCELLCGLALMLHGALWRLRARALPVVLDRPGGRRRAVPANAIFLGGLGVVLLAGRTGHALIAVPLHAVCGAVLAVICGVSGVRAARALVPVARRGMDALSEEPALRLGADVVLAAVLVALCLSLATDLVVADLLTLPR